MSSQTAELVFLPRYRTESGSILVSTRNSTLLLNETGRVRLPINTINLCRQIDMAQFQLSLRHWHCNARSQKLDRCRKRNIPAKRTNSTFNKTKLFIAERIIIYKMISNGLPYYRFQLKANSNLDWEER